MIYKSLNGIIILQYTCNSEMYSKTSILKEKKSKILFQNTYFTRHFEIYKFMMKYLLRDTLVNP